MRPDRDQDYHGLLWNRVVRVLCNLQTAFPYHDHHRSADDYDHPAAYDNDDHDQPGHDDHRRPYDNDVYDEVRTAAAHDDHHAVPSTSDKSHDDHHASTSDKSHDDHYRTDNDDHHDGPGGLVGWV